MPQPENRQIAGRYERALSLDRAAVNEETRTVNIAVSSEEPYMRWFGLETLGHDAKEVDLSFLKDGAPLLMDHDTRDQIGVIETVSLGTDKVLRAVVRFGRSARAQEVFQDVLDGIRSKISVGYEVIKYEVTKAGNKGNPDQVRATRWRPLEASFVAVPADPTVGVGRSLDGQEPSEPNPNPAALAATTEVRAMSLEPNPTAVAPQAAPPVNVQELRSQAVHETLQSIELGRALGLEDEARGLVAAGKSAVEINGALLELRRQKGPQPTPGTDPLADLGLTPKEQREYSFHRALTVAADIADGRNPEGSLEREVSTAMERLMPINYKRRGGVFVPLMTRTGLDSLTSTAGAELKYTEYGGEMIELYRNASVALRAGARMINGLSSPLSFPRQTAGSSGSWVAENPGSDVSESDATFDTVTLTPKTYMATTSFTRQLQVMGVVDPESVVRNDLAIAHALAWDRAYIHGTGTAQPLGLYGISGINTKAMGGAVAYGELLDMAAEVATDNALLGNLAFITTIGMANKLLQTLAFSAAGSDTIWRGTLNEGVVGGYRAIASNQVSSVMTGSTTTGGSEHGIIFGNHADAIIGTFGPGVEVVLDPYRLKKQGLYEVSSFGMVDIIYRHPTSFCKATGATLA